MDNKVLSYFLRILALVVYLAFESISLISIYSFFPLPWNIVAFVFVLVVFWLFGNDFVEGLVKKMKKWLS